VVRARNQPQLFLPRTARQEQPDTVLVGSLAVLQPVNEQNRAPQPGRFRQRRNLANADADRGHGNPVRQADHQPAQRLGQESITAVGQAFQALVGGIENHGLGRFRTGLQEHGRGKRKAEHADPLRIHFRPGFQVG